MSQSEGRIVVLKDSPYHQRENEIETYRISVTTGAPNNKNNR